MEHLDPGAINEITRATRRMLTERRTWEAVEAVAARLIETGYMSGRDVEEVCRALRFLATCCSLTVR